MTTENSSQDTSGSGSSSSDTSTSSSPSESSSTQTASSSGSQTSQGSDTSSVTDSNGAPTTTPSYQPNLKFKSFGKEYDIEDIFKGVIKDKETEEKIRKLHEKAYAMEPFQNESKKFKTDFDQYKSNAEPQIKAMGHFNNLLKNKDWDNFFGGLKVPEDEIFNWVQKRLELRSMPPEQRAEFERQAQVRQQNYQYENELSSTQEQYRQLATETRSMQLDNMLARQEIQSQTNQIDRAYGQPGAFRNLVIEEALNHYNRTGVDLPANQAVQLTVEKYSRFLQAQNQGAGVQPTMTGQGAASQGTSSQAAPIIPHVAGSARSPIKKGPRTLDDLKKLGREAAARDAQNQ